jgi:hypothetical protein
VSSCGRHFFRMLTRCQLPTATFRRGAAVIAASNFGGASGVLA